MFDWHNEAECRGTASTIFFPEDDIRPERRYVLDRMAKEICGKCVVQELCLDFALTWPELVAAGTWGGKTFKEIRRIRRKE